MRALSRVAPPYFQGYLYVAVGEKAQNLNELQTALRTYSESPERQERIKAAEESIQESTEWRRKTKEEWDRLNAKFSKTLEKYSSSNEPVLYPEPKPAKVEAAKNAEEEELQKAMREIKGVK